MLTAKDEMDVDEGPSGSRGVDGRSCLWPPRDAGFGRQHHPDELSRFPGKNILS